MNVSTVLLNLQTYGHFATEKRVPVITIESSWQDKSKESRIKAHVEIVKAVLRELRNGDWRYVYVNIRQFNNKLYGYEPNL